MIANRSAQHRILRLERIENGLRRGATVEIQLHFVANARQGAEVMRENDANHLVNPKSEIRSTKQFSNSKTKMLQTNAVGCFEILLCLVIRNLFRISRFEIRTCHLSVCASTDNTAGRLRTIAFQESP